MTTRLFLALLAGTQLASALDCNICGPGTENIIQNPTGVVNIVYEGVQRRQNCIKWQESKLVSEEWCEENFLEYTKEICQCSTKDGVFLSDIPEPTASPAPTVEGAPPVVLPDLPPGRAPIAAPISPPSSAVRYGPMVSAGLAFVWLWAL